jgi:hypothetical protein
MPLAAITPVLNDLLNKDGGTYPERRPSEQVNDSSNTSDYFRKASVIAHRVSSSSLTDDVSIFY